MPIVRRAEFALQYSIVVPIYGDGYLAPALCAEFHAVMASYIGTPEIEQALELIFVNDGSPDDSLCTLLALREQFPFVRVIDLSRNFGQHSAIACGMRKAQGRIVLRMNVDMQDPPSEIPAILEAMKEGDYDLVVGQYADRRSPLLDRLTAWLYYSAFRLLTGFNTPQNTSALRAMNRRFVDAYNELTEKSRFPQGLDQWLGFRHKYVRIEHRARIDKRSSYAFWSRFRLALNGVLYFSDRPLQLVATGGVLVSASGLALALYVIAEKLLGMDYLPGYASLASIGLVAFGIQVGCIGLLGLYIAKIFREVQNRPLYVIRESYGQSADAPD